MRKPRAANGSGHKSADKTTAGAKVTASAPAYKDANGNTLGGRGPRPGWLKDALARGAKLEDLATAQK